MDNLLLIVITMYIVAVILIIVVLNIIQKNKNTRYKKELDSLDIEKNKIVSAPILTELSKVEPLIKNEKLEVKYKNWNESFKIIKEQGLPKVTDILLEADFLVEQKDYKQALKKIAKAELEIQNLRSKSNLLLDQIKDVTHSEEKNRNIVAKLKIVYRELYDRFTNSRRDFDDIASVIDLQFENIVNRFHDFEVSMDQNDYDEVKYIVTSLAKMLDDMKVVIDEVPSIVLMGHDLIPKKIEEASNTYSKMIRDGYPLDYLNIEYNITEINKTINIIFDKLKSLNLDDSILELKTIIDYFDALFNDFEREKQSRMLFNNTIVVFNEKMAKDIKTVTDILVSLDDLKTNYDLGDEELKGLKLIDEELNHLHEDYDTLLEHSNGKTFAFTSLIKELDILNLRLSKVEDDLDNLLQSIGSLKDDEKRAYEQLDDIKNLLNRAKKKVKEYKLPVVPDHYYIELKEANDAITEIVHELDKKPINTKVLNIRVDTARDLAFKLCNTTNEMVKTAMLAEMGIIYGNRYRSSYHKIHDGLNIASQLFFDGRYKKSLETTLNVISLIEPDIMDKLLKVYGTEAFN